MVELGGRTRDRKGRRWTGASSPEGRDRADRLSFVYSTFNETMMALLTSSESTASSHLDLADKLASQVADQLREKERRKEVIRSRVRPIPSACFRTRHVN